MWRKKEEEQMTHRLNVYEACEERLNWFFENSTMSMFPFPEARTARALLICAVEYVRRNFPGRKLGVVHLDYERNTPQTTRYVAARLAEDSDILEVYHCLGAFQSYDMHINVSVILAPVGRKNPWERAMGQGICLRIAIRQTIRFFSDRLWDYDFQSVVCANGLRQRETGRPVYAALWAYARRKSYNRWRTIHSQQELPSFRFGKVDSSHDGWRRVSRISHL